MISALDFCYNCMVWITICPSSKIDDDDDDDKFLYNKNLIERIQILH